MAHLDRPQFTPDVFSAAYDQSSFLQNIVKDFDDKKIVLSKEKDLKPDDAPKSKDSVEKMAKRAVDLTDL